NLLNAGNNELVVKVWDPTDQGVNPHGKQTLNPGNIYYTPTTGIWQTVWLEKVPENYITQIRTTPDIDNGLLAVTVAASGSSTPITVEITAKAEGKEIGKVAGKPGEALQLPVKDARLWSPDDPYLYDLSVQLKSGSKTIDE